MKNNRNKNGFTIIEILISIIVLSIITLIAIPSMSNFVANQKIRSTAIELMGALKLAQTEALKRNGPVTLSINGNGWTTTYKNMNNVVSTIDKRINLTSNNNVSIAYPYSTITYSGDGLITPYGRVQTISFTRSNSLCVANGGEARCLNLKIGSGGRLKLCDPSVSSSNISACN